MTLPESTGDDVRAQRLANMERLAALGYPPFGGAFPRGGRLSEIRERFAEHQRASLAGRIVAKRDMGKSRFMHLDDGSGRFQVYIKKDAVGDPAFEASGILDIGDHIGAEGELFTTKTGEPTLKVERWTLLAKALLPLPEKWHGLHDVETRFRQRYLDLIANPDVRETFRRRAEILREIRGFLHERGFVEVETPMIQALAGGAAATPFKTHYAALGADMYLRIAPELYLKRLLVGGYDKVFELNRNFRNEGLSRSHNPEFTMLEIYEAYGDVHSMMRLVEDLVTTVARRVLGTLVLKHGEKTIDLTPPWRQVSYHDLITAEAGPDWFDLPRAGKQERAGRLGLPFDPAWNDVELTQEVFEKRIEKTLLHPTFVTRLPVELVPLAKACADDPSVVDVFELVADGRELAPAYSELNDPLEQRRRLEAQAGGDAARIDEDFLLALEHGMPPAGGMGIGIDRLVMMLTGADSIRDVILFPQLKPKA
jgi:lysyl-tRNA synthetase class 2